MEFTATYARALPSKAMRMVESGVVSAQRILIAEDDPDIAALMRHYLEKAGYSADVVETGRRAIDAATAHPPDLLILDLMLPELGGLDGVGPSAVARKPRHCRSSW